MATKTSAKLLIVDDRPDEVSPLARALKARRRRMKAEVRKPEEVTLDDLIDADLVLVDLDLEDWNGRRSSEAVALRPSDGLALLRYSAANWPIRVVFLLPASPFSRHTS